MQMVVARILLIIVSVCWISGCAIYQAQPLSDNAVNRALHPPSLKILRIAAAQIQHPLLRGVELHPEQGISPDEAAVMAVLVNPALRAERDRRGLAAAQVLQAGILPNPTLSYNLDPVVGGNTLGTVTAYGISGSWDLTGLITRSAKVASARAAARSVDLDIAWTEWQTAQAAKTTVFRVVALQEQVEWSREVEQSLRESADRLKEAADKHEKTDLDFATAASSSVDAQSSTLALEQELNKQRLNLKKLLGLPPAAPLRIRSGLRLPTHLDVPSGEALATDVQHRRLDLLALEKGYASQEESVRASILAQFPKIAISGSHASDTTNVHTAGFGITLDIPIFDRNQGNISTERATRQKLFDEYTNRIFEARAEIVSAIDDMRSLNRQIAVAESALPILRRLVDDSKTAYEAGNADVLTYYQARNDLQLKTLQVVKLKQQLLESSIALEIASGRFLPRSAT
jgi:cobalt-zinc-cadmium efflux system outer membrane protein